jgi:hypothetical protein
MRCIRRLLSINNQLPKQSPANLRLNNLLGILMVRYLEAMPDILQLTGLLICLSTNHNFRFGMRLTHYLISTYLD